jgi:uncharacterized protein
LKSYVLDASALFSFLEGRAAAVRVSAILESARSGEASVCMSVVNWGEVYYLYARKISARDAEHLRTQITELPIEFVEADLPRAQLAAEIKMRHDIGFADAFAAALAIERKATLVTSDRDFERAHGAVKILWLRSH